MTVLLTSLIFLILNLADINKRGLILCRCSTVTIPWAGLARCNAAWVDGTTVSG